MSEYSIGDLAGAALRNAVQSVTALMIYSFVSKRYATCRQPLAMVGETVRGNCLDFQAGVLMCWEPEFEPSGRSELLRIFLRQKEIKIKKLCRNVATEKYLVGSLK